jgi:26S proteasome regulatory subunit N13
MHSAMGAGGEQGRGGAAGGANSNVQVADLQNILQNMGLPASQTAPSPATSAASSAQTSHSGGASSAAATTASTHEHDVGNMEVDEMTEDELLRLAIEESMRDVQSDAGNPPNPDQSSRGSGGGSGSGPSGGNSGASS